MWFIISTQIEWAEQVTKISTKSLRRYATKKPVQDGKGRKNWQKTTLTTWNVLHNTLSFWIIDVTKLKYNLRNRVDKDAMYFRMILFKQMMLFQFCNLLMFICMSSLF